MALPPRVVTPHLGPAARTCLALLLVTPLLFVSSRAGAEPSAADKASARAMLDEGYAALGRGDGAFALRRFQGADALVGVPSTKLAIARAQIALGHLVEAEDALASALRIPAAPDEPGALKKARADAAELLAQTTPRVPELLIVLRGTAGRAVVVQVDGAVVPASALVAPRRLNPGAHMIEASAGEVRTSTSTTLAEAEKATVSLDLPAAPPPARDDPATKAEHAPAKPGISPLVLGALGLAATGLAVGTVTGVMALGRQGDAEASGCAGNRCPPPAHADVEAARDLAAVSTVGFVVAGVGLAAAAIAFFVPGRSGQAAAPSIYLPRFATKTCTIGASTGVSRSLEK